MPYILSFLVAVLTAGITWGAVLAIGGTDAYEKLVIVAVSTLICSTATAFVMTWRLGRAVVASALWTLIIVGGGFALIYALLGAVCGYDRSAC